MDKVNMNQGCVSARGAGVHEVHVWERCWYSSTYVVPVAAFPCVAFFVALKISKKY